LPVYIVGADRLNGRDESPFDRGQRTLLLALI
jgi:hypothetical protein